MRSFTEKIASLACVAMFVVLAGCSGMQMNLPDQPPTDMNMAERAPGSLDFDVVDYRWVYLNQGAHIRIKGTVRNNSSVSYPSVVLHGVLYDERGKAVAQGTSYLAPTYIKPGSIAEFDILTIPDRQSGIEFTRLITNCQMSGM